MEQFLHSHLHRSVQCPVRCLDLGCRQWTCPGRSSSCHAPLQSCWMWSAYHLGEKRFHWKFTQHWMKINLLNSLWVQRWKPFSFDRMLPQASSYQSWLSSGDSFLWYMTTSAPSSSFLPAMSITFPCISLTMKKSRRSLKRKHNEICENLRYLEIKIRNFCCLTRVQSPIVGLCYHGAPKQWQLHIHLHCPPLCPKLFQF